MKKTILIALVAMAALSCKKDTKVKADFTTSRSSYYLTESVNFSNTSTGSGSYSWTFGDNTTSTEANPTHAYQSPGRYSITLTADGSTVTKIIKVGAGTSSYVVANNTTAAVPLVSFFYDGTNVVELVDHKTIAAGQQSDTIYTTRPQITLGGYIGTKTFIAVTPYAINKFAHTVISLTGTTQIYVSNSVASPSLQILRSSSNKTASSFNAVN